MEIAGECYMGVAPSDGGLSVLGDVFLMNLSIVLNDGRVRFGLRLGRCYDSKPPARRQTPGLEGGPSCPGRAELGTTGEQSPVT
jgi:hypothetical protein